MTGRAEAGNFAGYHQILNRACWSSRAVARRLLGLAHREKFTVAEETIRAAELRNNSVPIS